MFINNHQPTTPTNEKYSLIITKSYIKPTYAKQPKDH